MKQSVILALMLLLALPAFAGSLTVNQQDYGDAWPFTVSEGVLTCTPPSAVTFRSEGKTYAINGTAKPLGHPWPDLIWRQDPDYPELKVSMGPIIEVGLALCD